MSQSRLLTRALEAAESILLSEEDDLFELAKIAGVSADVLYHRADLSGANLRGKEIGYLLEAECNLDAATVSPEQRRQFVKARRLLVREKAKQKNLDTYKKWMHEFVQRSIQAGRPTPKRGHFLDVPSVLEYALVVPLTGVKVFDETASADYFYNALRDFKPFIKSHNIDFFVECFELFGKMKCAVSNEGLEIVSAYELRLSEAEMNRMISVFHPEVRLDTFWISKTNSLERARSISLHRELHPAAVENVVLSLREADDVVAFLECCEFVCDGDTAERIAATITNSQWPSRHTQRYLSARINFRVSSAIFRQLVAQGIPERIVEIVKWLEDKRGAAGVLSLEDAFHKIVDFDMAWRLFCEIEPRLAENQRAAVKRTLDGLARSDYQITLARTIS